MLVLKFYVLEHCSISMSNNDVHELDSDYKFQTKKFSDNQFFKPTPKNGEFSVLISVCVLN